MSNFAVLLGGSSESIMDMNTLCEVFWDVPKVHQTILAILERAHHALDTPLSIIRILKDYSTKSVEYLHHKMKENIPIPSTKSLLFSAMPIQYYWSKPWHLVTLVVWSHELSQLWNQQVWSPMLRSLYQNDQHSYRLFNCYQSKELVWWFQQYTMAACPPYNVFFGQASKGDSPREQHCEYLLSPHQHACSLSCMCMIACPCLSFYCQRIWAIYLPNYGSSISGFLLYLFKFAIDGWCEFCIFD
jgi:hypothetical protein